MKLSQNTIFALLFFCAAFFAAPTKSLASSHNGIINHKTVAENDPIEISYNNPNLNASDGFDESEYKRKIQEKPKKKQKPDLETLVKHNL